MVAFVYSHTVEQIIKYVLANVRVIFDAPVAFFIVILVCIGAIWWIMEWRYGDRISTKDSEISLRNGEISLLTRQRDDYKDKLGGASPDQAKARVDNLEARLARLEPRRISTDQGYIIFENIKELFGPSHSVAIQSDMSCVDCNQYAADFQAVLSRVQWTIRMPGVMGPSARSPTGIAILTPDPNNPLPEAVALVRALTAAHILFELKAGSDPFQGLPGVSILNVAMLITAKATL
jgi:hypothetical protein